jgi:hypothetical protein
MSSRVFPGMIRAKIAGNEAVVIYFFAHIKNFTFEDKDYGNYNH